MSSFSRVLLHQLGIFPSSTLNLVDRPESPMKHSWSATMPRKFVKNICIVSLLKPLIFQLTSECWKSSKHRTTCHCYLNLFSAKAMMHAVFSCRALQGSRKDWTLFCLLVSPRFPLPLVMVMSLFIWYLPWSWWLYSYTLLEAQRVVPQAPTFTS